MNKKADNTIATTIESHLDRFFEMHDGAEPESGLYDRVIREVERALITKTIAYAGNVQTKAAQILGINRNTLRKKIKELEI